MMMVLINSFSLSDLLTGGFWIQFFISIGFENNYFSYKDRTGGSYSSKKLILDFFTSKDIEMYRKRGKSTFFSNFKRRHF